MRIQIQTTEVELLPRFQHYKDIEGDWEAVKER